MVKTIKHLFSSQHSLGTTLIISHRLSNFIMIRTFWIVIVFPKFLGFEKVNKLKTASLEAHALMPARTVMRAVWCRGWAPATMSVMSVGHRNTLPEGGPATAPRAPASKSVTRPWNGEPSINKRVISLHLKIYSSWLLILLWNLQQEMFRKGLVWKTLQFCPGWKVSWTSDLPC